MRFIIYTWGSNTDGMLNDKLVELGYDVRIFSRKCEHYTKDLKFAQALINLIHNCNADAVISNDYFPIISMVCNTVGIRYYSWVYDSPHYTLYAKTSRYECNRIGCFDRDLVKRLNTLGIDTVFHLPLGVDWSEGSEEDGMYSCDISFVGSLYTGEYNYYDEISDDNPVKKRMTEFIEKQCFEYVNDYICSCFRNENGALNYDFIGEVRDILTDQKLIPGDEYIEDVEYIFVSHFLEKKITVEERKRLLSEIVKLECDFRLYTASDISNVPELKRAYRGYVEYDRIMPLVFKQSRINLNMTLRSIHSGIPLRALDIMGCGGFLLSNYQEELDEYFVEDKEIVMYRSLDDCLEKIRYYLSHEEERKQIAEAGCRAVKDRFDYRKQLKKLLQ